MLSGVILQGLRRGHFIFCSAAVFLLTLTSGCFLFVFPEAPPEKIPESKPGDSACYHLFKNDSSCCMRIHLPPDTARKPCPAVVIFPGGAYGVLAWDKEGNDYAEFLNRNGIAGIVVKYPLGSLFGHFARHPAMINAAQQAIRLTRHYAGELGIDPRKIGVMGSSAGGHLAGLTAIWENGGNPASEDPAEQVSARPDFVILCYPVVSMEAPCSHQGSRKNLLGSDPSPELLRQLSLEKRITPGFPPVFLWLTLEDETVDPENSRMLEAELKRNQVPYKAVFYRKGPHGMGLLNGALASRYPETAQWPGEMLRFFREKGLFPPMEKRQQ